MLIIGLTGGIGCGKSTVTDLFKQKNIPVVDADDIAHDIVQPGQAALNILEQHFGPRIISNNGSLNRDVLRDIVFNNPKEKEILESILHPIIYSTLSAQLAKFTSPYGILSVPLLIETQHQKDVDRVLVIDCSESTQISRVKQRNQLSDETISSIMSTQCSRAFRLEQANEVITNEGSLEDLEQCVQALHERYLEISSSQNS
ncbi:MAG: dephospho-CoA kinase [Cycloclasticus sp.]|nr:dephospho-CoA kinase [Cycloclasticus sp.]